MFMAKDGTNRGGARPGAGAVIAKKEAALDYAALYAAADKQLYDSKRRGKNRYSIGEES